MQPVWTELSLRDIAAPLYSNKEGFTHTHTRAHVRTQTDTYRAGVRLTQLVMSGWQMDITVLE